MADENKDLIFPMHLDIDVQSFEKSWKEAEPQLQAVLDRKPLEAKLNVDLTGVQKSIELFQKIQEMGMAPKQSTQAAILIAQKKTEIMSENQALKVRQQNVIETNKLRISNANAEKSELALERAKQRGISAVHTQNKAYQAQRGLLNGLPQFVNSYISILGAYRLGQNIVDTTAEFEMQRVALAAIIQNKQKADELFAKDVELGLQSPFQIKELITYTKQLAAYRIESDSLFETTKRLADISAGLGVDMSRLVLAYGQVKAASVLRGQELRQFTEAGIPLIQLLADKFTKLNGVATTTGDVFKLISEREVSFEMVKSVFDDLTNAGGAFYRMQEIQAQTLKGSLSNLKDAYQKMFMQIGNENMGPMKGVIEGIKELMSNWRVIGEVATDVAVGYGVAKLAILAYNAALGKENAMNIASIMAAKKKEAALLTQASAYRKLEFGEALRLLSAKKMTAIDWEQLIIDKKLNGDMALRLVATKKMTVEDAKSIAVKLGLKDAEIAHAASMGRTKAIMMMATATVKAYTAAIWASTKALLTNPLTWALVAAAGLVKLISHIVSYNKEYSDMAKNIRK
jgi:tape measure domain-containing protein